MTIQNRKTGIFYEVSQEDWDKLTAKHQNRAFKVIDTVDSKKVNIPKEIIEYKMNPERLRITETDKPTPKKKV
jgi:hypothetical protein